MYYQRQPSFQEHCRLKGIELLRDDIKFIKQQLLGIPEHVRKSVLQKYSEIYLQGMTDCDNVIKKQNHGRFLANTFIQEFVENGSMR